MAARITSWLGAVLVLVSVSTVMASAQAKFSTIHSVHFEVRYIQGVTEADAQRIIGFLESDFDSLKKELGLEMKEKLEVRLYDSPGRYRSDLGAAKDVLSAMYVRGVFYALTTAPPAGLRKALRYQLARVFLEPTIQRSCPAWLCEAYAVYHSGIMSDLSAPGSVSVSSFSDLTQDIGESSSPGDRNDVNYVLGRTMQFFIERFGKQKAIGVFKEFDGSLSVESVFKKVFGQEFQDIEKAWAKYVAVKPRKGK